MIPVAGDDAAATPGVLIPVAGTAQDLKDPARICRSSLSPASCTAVRRQQKAAGGVMVAVIVILMIATHR